MTCAYEIFLVARSIIARIYPNHASRFQRIPHPYRGRIANAPDARSSVVRVRPRTSRSMTDLLSPSTSWGSSTPCPQQKLYRSPSTPRTGQAGRGIYSQDTAYCREKVSSVIAIKQTNQSTNQERPCTTSHQIKQVLSNWQSK